MDEIPVAATSTAADGESEIGRLISQLENQIAHLARSNKELEDFMKENGEQKELRVAIGENIVTIAKRRAMVEDLQRQAGLAPAKASVMATTSTDFAVGASAPQPPPSQPLEAASASSTVVDTEPMDTGGLYL